MHQKSGQPMRNFWDLREISVAPQNPSVSKSTNRPRPIALPLFELNTGPPNDIVCTRLFMQISSQFGFSELLQWSSDVESGEECNETTKLARLLSSGVTNRESACRMRTVATQIQSYRWVVCIGCMHSPPFHSILSIVMLSLLFCSQLINEASWLNNIPNL